MLAMYSAARFAIAFLLGPAALLAQRTWIVDQRGGGHFTDLAPAIAAAAAGDTLLLQGGGSYPLAPGPLPSPYVVPKELHIVADAPRPRIADLRCDTRALGGATVTI